MATHCGILAGKSHGQKSVMGYSLWGRRESDMTCLLGTHTYSTTTNVRVADDGLFDGRLFH